MDSPRLAERNRPYPRAEATRYSSKRVTTNPNEMVRVWFGAEGSPGGWGSMRGFVARWAKGILRADHGPCHDVKGRSMRDGSYLTGNSQRGWPIPLNTCHAAYPWKQPVRAFQGGRQRIRPATARVDSLPVVSSRGRVATGRAFQGDRQEMRQ